MATGPQLVHKQFNSPIGLYSRQNIEETLNKHLHHLDNGATGIDFNDPSTGKAGNLANSAVLRMLEEEERSRRGYPNQKKVVWPPAPETNGYHQPQEQQQAPAYYNKQPQQQQQQSPQYQSQPQQQYQQPQQQYQQPQQQYQQPQQQYQQPQQQYQQPQQQYQQPQQQYQQPPSRPAYCEGLRQEQPAINRLIPVSAGHSPQYRPGPASPQAGSQRSPGSQQQTRWAPVAPVSPQASPNYQQPSYSPQQPQYSPQQQYSSPQQQYSPQQQQYSSPQQQYSPQPQYQPPQPHFEPPPSTVTLRPHPPIHQQPSPVFSSQPAAASFQGGANMRGDMKWPPQSVKEAVAAENEARRLLAKGPACRPRKVKRDYTAFFAKNALGNTYPGYKVPPGTQHMGQTSF